MAQLLVRCRTRQPRILLRGSNFYRHKLIAKVAFRSFSEAAASVCEAPYALFQIQNAFEADARPPAPPSFNPPSSLKPRSPAKSEDWELTVGIEIHAQLNTDRKLFSRASTAATDVPNQHIAPFDLALPGAQPVFQKAVLIPALRAALALGCAIQPESAFDRKHYFYHDQPAGYQITQYYAPFARNGRVKLWPHDGTTAQDGQGVEIGIERIQLEQDTAKTLIDTASGATLLDYNRAGCALVEIITRPEIHHPKTAAACVRKIQRTLECVGAVTTGMELGGLRADVNVSVRRRSPAAGMGSDGGAGTLGQRTEIKNLSSLKAVESAIIAERDRQIYVLEAGGRVEGETRGWSLGSTETRKLRGKEGEVDYRYMPDPDIPPLRVGSSLVEYIRGHLPVLPDEQVEKLVDLYKIKEKDASILANLDDGQRLEYFYEVIDLLVGNHDHDARKTEELGKLAFNWTVHELGGLLTVSESSFEPDRVPAQSMSSALRHLFDKNISRDGAKKILAMIFEGDRRSVGEIIKAEELSAPAISNFDYEQTIETLAAENPKMAGKIRAGQKGVQQWFVGQLIRRGGKEVDPHTAMKAVEQFFGD